VRPEAGLDRCGKSRPTGIRSPDLPTRSESLYRLSYPGSIYSVHKDNYKIVPVTISVNIYTTVQVELNYMYIDIGANNVDVLNSPFLTKNCRSFSIP